MLSSSSLSHKNTLEKSYQVFKSDNWILKVVCSLGVASCWLHFKPLEGKYLSILWVFCPSLKSNFLSSKIFCRRARSSLGSTENRMVFCKGFIFVVKWSQIKCRPERKAPFPWLVLWKTRCVGDGKRNCHQNCEPLRRSSEYNSEFSGDRS